jgi:hypothetical protein
MGRRRRNTLVTPELLTVGFLLLGIVWLLEHPKVRNAALFVVATVVAGIVTYGCMAVSYSPVIRKSSYSQASCGYSFQKAAELHAQGTTSYDWCDEEGRK